MENRNKPAYPAESQFINGSEFLECSIKNGRQYPGLTKRELFAMYALQGILVHTSSPDNGTVKLAIDLADELLKQLDNEKA